MSKTSFPKKAASRSAISFVVIMGIVSLFSDMTHEGARSIYGVFLGLAGASAAAIGFATGLGEFVGYALRLGTGFLADKYQNYWKMTFIGYLVNMLAIPALAFTSDHGWIYACVLIILERAGKAVRQPSKNTLVSFAASKVGAGKSFAIQEFLDQIGAFLGPTFLFLVLWMRGRSAVTLADYALCFALLGIPALFTLLSLWFAKHRFPHPEDFEVDAAESKSFRWTAPFTFYIVGISLFAFGFLDFPLITYHVSQQHVFADAKMLPLLYSGAMIVDAFAALFFGWMFDRYGLRVLMLSTLLSSGFAVLIFGVGTRETVICGIVLWGIGMGAQESILKSAVASLMPKSGRSTGFGIFATAFGLCWFAGSWLMGVMYDVSLTALVAFSLVTQLAAVPLFYFAAPKKQTSAQN
jgi:MFS family permease